MAAAAVFSWVLVYGKIPQSVAASIQATPSSSRARATAILSWTEKVIPSPWAPSRRVVSNISTWGTN
mgnify:CR=1 FL=1